MSNNKNVKSIRDVINGAVLEGFMEANKTFENISRGWWVFDYGVEGYVSGKIAEYCHNSLNNLEHEYAITLEEPMSYIEDVIRKPGSKRRGKKPAGLRNNGRIDLCIWRKDSACKTTDNEDCWEIIGVIEVKRSIKDGKTHKDLERIRMLIEPGRGSLEYAAVIGGFYMDKIDNENAMKTTIKRVKSEIESKYEMSCTLLDGAHKTTWKGKDYYMTACAIEFQL